MKTISKIILSIIGLIILLTLNYFLSIKLLNYFISDLKDLNITIFTNHIGESLTNILTIDIILTFIILLPILVIWFYIEYKVALRENERLCIKLLIIPYILAIIGVIFSYYITINYIIKFLIAYNSELEIINMLNLTSIISFTLLNMLFYAIIFQTPVIMWLLTKFNIIKKSFFKEYRRHFFIGITLISAIIAPADLFSMLFMMFPTQLLYELGIIISK